MYLSESLHLYEIADYWRAIIDMNEHQKQRFTKRIISCLYNNLAGKKLAVLGFAFKKDTSDTRESPAITLVTNFLTERARVAIYDPRVPQQQIWRELADNGCDPETLKRNVSVCSSAYTACEAADAVVLITEWDEFSNKTVSATVPITKENQQIRAAASTVKSTTPLDTPREAADQGVSRLSRSGVQKTASFRIPPRKSAGIVIKDPKNGEVKTFSTQQSSPDTGLLLRDPNIPPERTDWSSLGRSVVSPANVESACDITSSIDGRLRAIEMTSDSKPPGRLDWARIASSMRKPMFVFDGRNILDHGKLEALGFRVEAIGKRGTTAREPHI